MNPTKPIHGSQSKTDTGATKAGLAPEHEQKLLSLLDKLDARDAMNGSRHGRQNTRAAFRRFGVKAIVHHPGGSMTARRVLTRDISAGGLGFIDNGYLHLNTRVDIVLSRHGGGDDVVRGKVVQCDHIAGAWHAVGVKFEHQIVPKLYLDPDQFVDMEIDARQAEAIVGRVLLIDQSDLDRRLFAHNLRRTRVELRTATTLADGERIVKEPNASFDLVVFDLQLSTGDGPLAAQTVVSRVKAMGIGRIAVCSENINAEVLRKVQSLGLLGFLTKPYEPQRLLACLRGWLGFGLPDDGPIYSTLANQSAKKRILAEFVVNVGKLGQALGQTVQTDDFQRCRAVCNGLRASGTAHGFRPITQAATEALRLLDSTHDLAQAITSIARLQDLCARATDAVPSHEISPALAA